YYHASLPMRTFGQWLRDHRVRCRWTQLELAHQLQVATSTVSRWERDCGEPSVMEFRELCLLFRVSADAALGTGGGEIQFAAKRGTKEADDGDEEKRLGHASGPGGDGEAQVSGQANAGRARPARRRNGRLRSEGRGP